MDYSCVQNIRLVTSNIKCVMCAIANTIVQPDSDNSLYKHTETPNFSSQRYNPLVDSNTDVPTDPTVCPNGPVSIVLELVLHGICIVIWCRLSN